MILERYEAAFNRYTQKALWYIDNGSADRYIIIKGGKADDYK